MLCTTYNLHRNLICATLHCKTNKKPHKKPQQKHTKNPAKPTPKNPNHNVG